MCELEKIHVHALDDNPLHHYALESITLDLPHISLTCSGTLRSLDALDGLDVLLVHLDHGTMCPRYLVGTLLESVPDVPLVCYASAVTGGLGGYFDTYRERLITISYDFLLKQLREFIRLLRDIPEPRMKSIKGSMLECAELQDMRRLSPREKDIYCLVGKGLGAVEISDQVGCGVRTVETHLKSIRHRLRIGNLVEMRRSAIKLMKKRQCKVLSERDNHHCPHIGKTVGECPFL